MPTKLKMTWGQHGSTVGTWIRATQRCAKPFSGGAGVSCCVQVTAALQQCPAREADHFLRGNGFYCLMLLFYSF